MTPETNAAIVSRLFLASGRKPEDGTFRIWEEALEDLSDDVAAEEASKQVVRTTDMTYGPPSPVMVRDAYQAIMRRRDRMGDPSRQLVEETNPVVADAEARKAGLAQALATLERRHHLPGPDKPALTSSPTKLISGGTAHDWGDHQHCGPSCSDAPPMKA